mmetsp:Transcript_26424/g.25576  ORF Transcript_26424/g.25576 Transcript_26424/m.25576 type:complete len:136 (+) Transcript_26424:800-1207(+)
MTAMGAALCCFFIFGGIGMLTYQLKACFDSYEIIFPVIGFSTAVFFLATIPTYFFMHTYLMMNDMTTKEYEYLRKERKFGYVLDKKTSIPCSQKLQNLFNLLIFSPRRADSELLRPIHRGIPLEYEATDLPSTEL